MKLHRATFRNPVTLCFPDGANTLSTALTPAEGRRLDAEVDWGRRAVILKGQVGQSQVYRVLPFEVFSHFDVLQDDWPQLVRADTDMTAPINKEPAGKTWFVRPE